MSNIVTTDHKKPSFSSEKPGILRITLNDWNQFYEVITNEIATSSAYVWRGQGDSAWPMQSSFDRAMLQAGKEPSADLLKCHLENFKYAVRGRRGENPFDLKDDKDWWALGQHQGLKTPLLDWSESPFVALYFAFSTILDPLEKIGRTRAVYALNKHLIGHTLRTINGERYDGPFVHPLVSDNPRLISQRGLFTMIPPGNNIKSWIKTTFSGHPISPPEEENPDDESSSIEEQKFYLIEIIIPDTGKNECLIALNRMNISHLTLFPDLSGASEFCNQKLVLDEY